MSVRDWIDLLLLIIDCAIWFCVGFSWGGGFERIRRRKRAQSMSDLARKYAGTQG